MAPLPATGCGRATSFLLAPRASTQWTPGSTHWTQWVCPHPEAGQPPSCGPETPALCWISPGPADLTGTLESRQRPPLHLMGEETGPGRGGTELMPVPPAVPCCRRWLRLSLEGKHSGLSPQGGCQRSPWRPPHFLCPLRPGPQPNGTGNVRGPIPVQSGAGTGRGGMGSPWPCSVVPNTGQPSRGESGGGGRGDCRCPSGLGPSCKADSASAS